MIEIAWSQIRGYGDKYEVSACGMIRNRTTDKTLYQHQNRHGYRYVCLWNKNIPKNCAVHRLVLSSFSGEDGDGLEVNHIDGVKHNNHVSNLEWVTSSENKRHLLHVLGVRAPIFRFGSQNSNASPVEALDSFGVVVHRFSSIVEAEQLGFKAPSICHALKGIRQKTHAGLSWRYAADQKATAA